jgi:ubiquinone/menaquinone biosynthesis C-methylase UbiE
MKLNFIKGFLNKTIAKQLRKPSGILAGKVGNEMNITNSFLYDFTIEAMQLKNDESILEIGFGNGKFFDKIFSTANDLKISGLDFSPEMVKVAIGNNPSTSNTRKLTLRLGSSDKIPFPDNSFDKVFCINVIYFWEQPAAHLKEIYRVLKPGGRFYTTIRTKESLVQMPFAKYGFSIYTQNEWVTMLETSYLHFVHTKKTQNEPDAKIDKQLYKMESLCIVAENPGLVMMNTH